MFLIEFAECVLTFSSVHMEESSVMHGAQGMLVQNWPTVSSAAGEYKSGSQDRVTNQQKSVSFFGATVTEN